MISHAPPYGTKADAVPSGAVARHVGSYAVRRFIEAAKPVLAICGHIHEARCVDRLGGCTIVNPGPAKLGRYAIVKLSGGQAEVDMK